MQRSYLSLAQSRAMALEYPVGDPFGGAAYGQRAMPVVAVAAAALSISAGVGMLTAGTAILGSTMLGTVVGGALIAGGALSIAGTLTGNEKLSKIGNTLQLVGGVSAFAASATGTMTSTAGMSAGAAGRQMSLGEATKVGVDKIATSFDSTMGTTIGNQVSNAFGATGAEASMLKANMPAPIAPLVTPVAPGAAPVAPGAAPAMQGASTGKGGLLGMSIGEMATVGSLAASAPGAFANADAAKAANEWNKAEAAKKEQNANYVPRFVRSQADIDAMSPESRDEFMLFSPQILTRPSSSITPPTVNPAGYNLAAAPQATSVVNAVPSPTPVVATVLQPR